MSESSKAKSKLVALGLNKFVGFLLKHLEGEDLIIDFWDSYSLVKPNLSDKKKKELISLLKGDDSGMSGAVSEIRCRAYLTKLGLNVDDQYGDFSFTEPKTNKKVSVEVTHAAESNSFKNAVKKIYNEIKDIGCSASASYKLRTVRDKIIEKQKQLVDDVPNLLICDYNALGSEFPTSEEVQKAFKDLQESRLSAYMSIKKQTIIERTNSRKKLRVLLENNPHAKLKLATKTVSMLKSIVI